MDLITLAYGLVILGGIYLLAGLIFCILLFSKGISHIDSSTKNTGLGFKILIIPGIMVFWPALWIKWKGKKSP